MSFRTMIILSQNNLFFAHEHSWLLWLLHSSLSVEMLEVIIMVWGRNSFLFHKSLWNYLKQKLITRIRTQVNGIIKVTDGSGSRWKYPAVVVQPSLDVGQVFELRLFLWALMAKWCHHCFSAVSSGFYCIPVWGRNSS